MPSCKIYREGLQFHLVDPVSGLDVHVCTIVFFDEEGPEIHLENIGNINYQPHVARAIGYIIQQAEKLTRLGVGFDPLGRHVYVS